MATLPKHVLASKVTGSTVMVAPGETIDVRGTTEDGRSFDEQIMAHLGNPYAQDIAQNAAQNGRPYSDELSSEILNTARSYRSDLQRTIDASIYDFNEVALYEAYDNGSFIVTTPIIARMKFDKADREDTSHNHFRIKTSGAGQTTQPYKIHFEALNGNSDETDPDKALVAALHAFDDDLFSDCDRFMTSEEQQTFFMDYAIMAEISNHDYLHAITTVGERGEKLYTPDQDTQYGMAIERHALALHAQIMEQSFERLPKKRDKVLEYGQRTFGLLAQMQERVDRLEDPVDKVHSAQALTALTESYAQCFFRVISPRDVDLDRQVSAAYPTINDSIDAIDIQTNMNMVDAQSEYDASMSNKDKLCLALSVVSYHSRADVKLRPGMYEDIHDIDHVKMTFEGEEDQLKIGLVELLDIAHQVLHPSDNERNFSFQEDEHDFIGI